MSASTTKASILERSKGWVWWIVSIGFILIIISFLWNNFGEKAYKATNTGKTSGKASGASAGVTKVVALTKATKLLDSIEVTGLPVGTWIYTVTQSPMRVKMPWWESDFIVTRPQAGDWSATLNGTLPEGKVTIDQSGKGIIRLDPPERAIEAARNGQFEITQPGEITIVLR